MIQIQLCRTATYVRRPRRAMEPADPLLRAALVGACRRGGDPCARARRDRIKVAQRLAAGMVPAEVARAERTDVAAIDALLAQTGFREFVDGYKALAEQPAEA